MPELGWREAIIEVLKGKGEAMHYTDITDEILEQGLKTSVGATPASSVNVTLSDSVKYSGSPFERTARGFYRLRVPSGLKPEAASAHQSLANEYSGDSQIKGIESEAEEAKEITGLINAFGMFWAREKINWAQGSPKLLGKQAQGSDPVDFSEEQGVYLLYDRSDVVYIGRAIDQGIGTRLKQHTYDRLAGRWDRFSWFGIFTVSPGGQLEKGDPIYDRRLLIATMEALLIESVEPSQNRRRGDEFRAIEFLQAEDPNLELNRKKAFFAEMQSKLGL
jgi:hypothetical protein